VLVELPLDSTAQALALGKTTVTSVLFRAIRDATVKKGSTRDGSSRYSHEEWAEDIQKMLSSVD
jgi:hypothetical protein